MDGRIHAQFKPLGTVAGRFSSADPNLQNVGRGALRSCFRPSDESLVLVVADYSQIELRVAAAIAKDNVMLDAFRSGEDLHRKTAAAVLNKDVEAITKADRQLAKAVNFGLLYGQGAEGLVRYAKTSYGVTLESEQATSIRSAFFKHYTGLSRWHKQAWNKVKSTTEVRTLLGRRRLIRKEASDWEIFTTLVNTPVQGTSADALKIAMVELAPKLAPYNGWMVATVHDELVIECARSSADDVRNLCVEVMVAAANQILKNAVPIEVEAKVCECWGNK